MTTEMNAESLDAQVPMDVELVIRVQAETEPYYFAVDAGQGTNDTTAEVVMKDILRKYREAWQELAKM